MYTFNHLFDVIQNSNNKGSDLVFECGYEGGRLFGKSFDCLDLTSEEKISRWCKFDSSVGWGKFSHNLEVDRTQVSVVGTLSIKNCFQHKGNCEYIRGYCSGVLESITGLNLILNCVERCDSSISKNMSATCCFNINAK